MMNAISDTTPASELEALAAEVRRLRMDWQRPEPFYEQRSEIAGALMRISRRLGYVRAAPVPIPLAPRRNPLFHVERTAPVPMPRAKPKPLAAAAPPEISRTANMRQCRIPMRRHRYPRPPTLPSTVQPQLL
jgi:hypothetical protein